MTKIKFEIQIESTQYDWSWVSLWAYEYWWIIPIGYLVLRYKSIPNSEINEVKNDWIQNAEKILKERFDKYNPGISKTVEL